MTVRADNVEPGAIDVYRIWLGDFGYGQWFSPTHLRIDADEITYCGITMLRPGYWWSGAYDKGVTPKERINCKRCLKKLYVEKNVETLRALLDV